MYGMSPYERLITYEPYKPANGWEVGKFYLDGIDMTTAGGVGPILRSGFWDGKEASLVYGIPPTNANCSTTFVSWPFICYFD